MSTTGSWGNVSKARDRKKANNNFNWFIWYHSTLNVFVYVWEILKIQKAYYERRYNGNSPLCQLINGAACLNPAIEKREIIALIGSYYIILRFIYSLTHKNSKKSKIQIINGNITVRAQNVNYWFMGQRV